MSSCARSSDCEYDATHWPSTPCGRHSVECADCGFPLPYDDDADADEHRDCPHGWRKVTVADLKDLATEAGVDTLVSIGDDGTVRAETLPASQAGGTAEACPDVAAKETSAARIDESSVNADVLPSNSAFSAMLAAHETAVRAKVAEELKPIVERLTTGLLANVERLDEPFTDMPELSPWKRDIRGNLERLRAFRYRLSQGTADGEVA